MSKFRVLPYEHYIVLRGNSNAVAKAYGPGEIVEIDDITKDIQRAKLEPVEEDESNEPNSELPVEEGKVTPAEIQAKEPESDTKARAIERLKGK